jgi:hypothetical protein
MENREEKGNPGKEGETNKLQNNLVPLVRAENWNLLSDSKQVSGSLYLHSVLTSKVLVTSLWGPEFATENKNEKYSVILRINVQILYF